MVGHSYRVEPKRSGNRRRSRDTAFDSFIPESGRRHSSGVVSSIETYLPRELQLG
jgi:hypothetical protein